MLGFFCLHFRESVNILIPIFVLMRKLLAYPLSLLSAASFMLWLLIFDPIQRVTLNLFGYQAHKRVIDFLNAGLISSLYLGFNRVSFKNEHQLPTDAPLIFASNHQSLMDIPPLIWFFRKHHPKFVSKKELGKGIPSVSYNLRRGGAALIDRKNPREATRELIRFGNYLSEHKRSAVIFPEGTRSRTGEPKKWRRIGLATIMKKIPEGYVVPVTINNSYKIFQYGMFPLGIGNHIKIDTHAPLKISDFNNPDELIDQAEQIVNAYIKP